MMSVGISNLGRTDLYCDVLLLQKLLPDIRQKSRNDFVIFQQDSASAHRARETVTMVDKERRHISFLYHFGQQIRQI